MTTAKRFFLTAAFAATLALPARGYNDVVTHPQLTIIAAEKSALYTDGTIMFSLGLLPADQQYFLYGARGGRLRYGTAVYPLSAFIGEGAFDEDIGDRARNHFFDPYHDSPLIFGGLAIGYRSWEWMLEEQATLSGQNRSLSDARGYLRRAMTFNEGSPAVSDEARGIAIAEMFLSLGHAAHHMQDMAQPQHVRNDLHWDEYPYFFNPLYNPSRYEAYTAERGPFVEVLAEMATPNYPGPAEFKTARDFWFNTSNTGIAQLTNTQFVSKDTNFTISKGQVNVGTYPLPVPGAATNYTVQALFTASGVPVPSDIQTLCGSPAINCTMTMYSTAVSPKASTLSIFDQDLRKNGKTLTFKPDSFFPTYETERLFALNRFNFDDAHDVLIGRAVAYSAGILNHFFRGKFEVMAPATGPWAVVDHSAGKGFTKIRARVKNITGEELRSGWLRAIAKFHRNECYTADLSGEFTLDSAGQLVSPPCPAEASYRSDEAHLRLTAEEVMGFAVGETKEMTFTFTDPIPLDATDLILQVFYRGMVGEEVDSFALGAADLSEPTYIAIMNATDVFELNGSAFYDYDDIINNITQSPYSIVDLNHDGKYLAPPDVDVRGGDIRYEVSLNGQKVADIPALPEGRFARLAALVSPFGFQLTLTAFGNGFGSIDSYEFGAKTFQYAPEFNALLISPVDKLRNQTLQFDSVSYYHYYPTTGTPLSKMPPSGATDATVLIPLQMAADTLLQSESPASLQQTTTSGVQRGSRAQAGVGGKPIKSSKPPK